MTFEYRGGSRRGGRRTVRGRTVVNSVEDALLAAAEIAAGKLTLRVWQALTSATPVDLGTARSGWTPTTGAPETEEITRSKDREVAKREASARLATNQQAVQALAGSYRLRQGAIFLSNPVPWIVPLNTGTSSQAPAMFVEQALATATRSFSSGSAA